MKTIKTVEIYLKLSTPFMVYNWKKLLPDWEKPPQTVIIILLPSEISLNSEGELTEQIKDDLLKRFIDLGEVIKNKCDRQGILTEIISPKDGTPLYSSQGELTFDFVVIIHQLLGFDFARTPAGCKVLNHPVWGNAFYPGLLVSLASITEIEPLISQESGVRSQESG